VSEKYSTLVWAIDPMEKNTRPPMASFARLRRWVRELDGEILPVTVVSPSARDLERGLLAGVDRYQTAIEAYVATYGRGVTRPPHVLVNESGSRDGEVAMLLRYAKEVGAGAIAVSSHGRSGLDRLVLGSFAEALLERAPIPVLFLSHLPRKAGAERIFFPTDFSADSRATWRDFLRRAKATKAEVQLYHAVTCPIPPVGVGVFLPDSLVEEQENWATKQAAQWVEEARENGVRASGRVVTGGVGAPSGEAVLAGADEFKATTLVLNANSGVVGRFLLGSIAYPVFRASRFLTIVYGPKLVQGRRREGTRSRRATAER
jgi:nucleotide-binding universal stress UspA family protein